MKKRKARGSARSRRRPERLVTSETPPTPKAPDARAPVDVVDEASDESFPASDAPGWGSTTIT